MTTNDTLLIKMIEMDMVNKSVSSFVLCDEVAIDPAQIKIGANEVVYIYLMSVQNTKEFDVSLVSASSVVKYSPLNTLDNSSSIISSHWGNISVKKANAKTKFHLRFIRVTINK